MTDPGPQQPYLCAYAAPAAEHPRYREAVVIAERSGWHPGWIQNAGDVLAVVEHGCHFEIARARHVEDFFHKFIKHGKDDWAGQVFDFMPWQRDHVVFPIFGWIRPDLTRRFRFAYIEIPKKNGKSALLSGLGLYLLMKDGVAGSEVYSAASDRKQAGRIHDESASMVRKSPALKKRLRIVPYTKQIFYGATDSWYEALSSDADNSEGLNPHGLLFDELHVQKNRRQWRSLVYGDIVRASPLFLVITTSGIYDPQSIGWEQHDLAKKILENSLPDWEHFAYIRSAQEEMEKRKAAGDDPAFDWQDPAMWELANPAYGLIISKEKIAGKAKKSRASLVAQQEFMRYILNIWVGQRASYIGAGAWNACANGFKADSLQGRVCYGGLDLSCKDDLSSFVLCFPPNDGDEKYKILSWFWLPSEMAIELEAAHSVPYTAWGKTGDAILTTGPRLEEEEVVEKILALDGEYDIQEIAADPSGANYVLGKLLDAGIVAAAHGQSARAMNDSYTELESLVTRRKLAHTGHPVMGWHISNASISMDVSGNIKVAKAEKQKRNKVDGVVAAALAVGRARLQENAQLIHSGDLLVVGGD